MAYTFHKLADDWGSLSDAQKEALFTGTNYIKPSLSELIALNEPFRVASFDGMSGNKSVYLNAVPKDKLFMPNALFGGTFETIDNIKATVNVAGGDVSLTHFDADFTDSVSGREWKKIGNVVLNNNTKKFGNASLYLDGSTYIYSTNDIQDFNFGNKDFSIEMWVYPTTNSSTQALFSFSSEYHGVAVRMFESGTNNIVVYWSSNGTSWNIIDSSNGKSADNVITLNTWNHIAFTRNEQHVKLFVNGISVVSVELDLTQDNTIYFSNAEFQLGAYANGSNLFTGLIDEVRIAKGMTHYKNNFIPDATAFSSAIELPKVKFAITKDLSNYYTFDESSIIKTTTTEQVATTIATMNGSNQYLTIPASILNGKSEWTIEVVMRTTQISAGNYAYNSPGIFGFDIAGSGYEYFIQVRNGYLAWYCQPSSGDIYRYTDKFIADGNKHNIALVSDSLFCRLYCDGELIDKFPYYGHTHPNHDIYVGYALAFCAMDLYEVRVWDVARQQNYIGADIKPTAVGLKSWYLMDNISGSVVADASNAGNDGIVTNSPTVSTIQETVTKVEETSGFKRIDPFNVSNVLSEGIDKIKLENISDKQWDMFFSGIDGDAGLGIAFALSQETVSQVAAIDDITIYVDMKGEWRSAHKGEDFEYGYPNNNLLRVQLLTDGDYKINYQNMVGGM